MTILSPKVERTQTGYFRVWLEDGTKLEAATRMEMKIRLRRLGLTHRWYFGN